MEAVAAAASIAGLVALAGQCISGAEKMISFCNEVRTAEWRVMRLKEDVNSLLRSLQDAAELCERLEHDIPAIGAQAKITSLQCHLDDCNKALAGWLEVIRKHQQTDRPTWFKQVWRAINKASRDELHSELRRRRDEINLTMLTIGSTVNLRTATVVKELAPAVKATEQNLAILQKDLTAANTREEAHFQRVHVNLQAQSLSARRHSITQKLQQDQLARTLQKQASAIGQCSSNESIQSLRSEMSAGFRDMKTHMAARNAQPVDTVDTRILLKWIGAGRPGSFATWVQNKSWCRQVECESYRCYWNDRSRDIDDMTEDKCFLCGRRDADISGHVRKVHLNRHAPCSPSWKFLGVTCDFFCEHLRDAHGPVLLDQQALREVVRSKFFLRWSVAKTMSSYNDSNTAKKVRALLPGAAVISSDWKLEDSDDDRGEAIDEKVAQNTRDLEWSESKAEAENKVRRNSLEPMVDCPDTDAAVTVEQPVDMGLMQRSWNASLLEDWDGMHDRINKWMLHVLSSDCDGLAEVHRGYLFEAEQKHTTSLTTSELSGRSWDRLVLKYWFLDEAALSIDALAAGRGNAHLFDMPRDGKGSLALHSYNGHLMGMPPSINQAYADDAELICRGETQSEGREALSRRRMERANSRAVHGPSSI
ncbi:hypothetical protein LTR17_004840 [Elasticomyces elasticus]|nr:hypothetical protein LTR17_004840 [Elasticomyces elasticus]